MLNMLTGYTAAWDPKDRSFVHNTVAHVYTLHYSARHAFRHQMLRINLKNVNFVLQTWFVFTKLGGLLACPMRALDWQMNYRAWDWIMSQTKIHNSADANWLIITAIQRLNWFNLNTITLTWDSRHLTVEFTRTLSSQMGYFLKVLLENKFVFCLA